MKKPEEFFSRLDLVFQKRGDASENSDARWKNFHPIDFAFFHKKWVLVTCDFWGFSRFLDPPSNAKTKC